MKLLTFVRQCGQRMRILTEIQFPYERFIKVWATRIRMSWLHYPSSQQQRHGKINSRYFYFVQWSTQNHEVFFRNAGLLEKNGWWFDFLIKAKIGNFKAWHWWGKMKSFWTVSISELKHISLSSTGFYGLPLLDSYLLLGASRASRPIMGVNYIFAAPQFCFLILFFI